MKIIHQGFFDAMLERIRAFNSSCLNNDREKDYFLVLGVYQSGKTFLIKSAMEKLRNEGLFDDEHIVSIDLEKTDNNVKYYPDLKNDGKPYLIFCDNCTDLLSIRSVDEHYSKIDKAVFICAVEYNLLNEERNGDDYFDFLFYFSRHNHTGAAKHYEACCVPGYIKPEQFLKVRDITCDRQTVKEHFDEYLKYGSFPAVAARRDLISRDNILKTTCECIVGKVCDAEKCRIDILNTVLKYVLKNVGRLLTTTEISQNTHLDYSTVLKYIDILKNNSLIYECRYKKIDPQEIADQNYKKYYAGFTSFIYNMLDPEDFPQHKHLLENVFLILQGRFLASANNSFGGSVSRNQFDFFFGDPWTVSNNFQDFYNIHIKETAKKRKSEFSNQINTLKRIPNDGVKIMLTEDDTEEKIIDGVYVINIYDWFLDKSYELYDRSWNNK